MPLLVLSSIFITVALMAFFYRKKTPVAPETLVDETPMLRFWQSSLHTQNQQLLVKGQEKKLTFRETKLLHYLVEHANQVLDREQILAAVWQDEGMLVGRSLDVFVSRLRKLLQDDASINIASVHSVGYRFETELSAS
jgi:DNA-binding winged helix-turn-helix (wHTH) protein